MKKRAEGRRVSDLGEDALIEKLVAKLVASKRNQDVVAGPGDDCAVMKSARSGFYELLKTDCVVEGVHFLQGTRAEQVGRKAICRAVSDIAAMGGVPRFATVTIALGTEHSVAEVEAWYAGMAGAAQQFNVEIVGGETSSLPEKRGAVISVSMTGEVEKENCVFRSGARMGDAIAVTGRLGNAFASERHLHFTPRLKESRWMVSESKNCRPSSMMDLSDGLSKDLPRLLRVDGWGYQIDPERIPLNEDADLDGAIKDGEDYELLMTFPSLDEAEWKVAFPETPLTVIGEVVRETSEPLDPGGYEHFRR